MHTDTTPLGPVSMVLEFHQTFGVPINHTATAEHRQQRAVLLWEEAGEVFDALRDGTLADIAKELADLLYVTYGTALALGIDLDTAVAAVHTSNMTKLGTDGKPILRHDGKVLKGPGYQPADMSRALPGRFGEVTEGT